MSATPSAAATSSVAWFAWFRLAAAVVLTTLLTLGWGRTLIFTMFLGKPERIAAGATAAVLLVVLALTWRLRPRLALPASWVPFDTRLTLTLLALWCLAYAGLFIWYIASLHVPLWQLYVLFVPSTLWVLFTAWFGYWRGRPSRKLALLALLLLLAVDFPLVVKVDGMTGDGQMNLAWRDRLFGGEEENAGVRPAAVSAAVAPARGAWSTSPADFPRFLGVQGNGQVPQAAIAGDWSAAAPRELWRIPVGLGWSSFAIVGDFCFTQEQQGGEECIVCRELRTGSPVWRHADAVRFDGSLGGPGPRATPTISAGRLYAVGGTGMLNCLDAATGEKLWAVDLMKDNGCATNLAHGVCGSPLVHEGKVYVSPPGEHGKSLVAYAADTGERLWQAGQHRASYSSPQLVTLVGRSQILVYHSEGVSAHDPADGRELWFHPWTNSVRVNASQPIVFKDSEQEANLLVSTGYDRGSTLIRLRRSGEEWTAETVWANRLLQTKFTTAILWRSGGKVFGLDNGILMCLDPESGKRLWKAGRYNHGQLLLAGDRTLIVQTEDGAVVLVEASAEKLIERGKVPALTSKTWNHPALAGRYLLVRNDQEAVCYELPPAATDAEPTPAAETPAEGTEADRSR